MIHIVPEAWESLSSLCQLLARLPVWSDGEGTGLVPGVLLASKDLVTPVPVHEHPSWGRCLVSESAMSQHSGETLHGDLYHPPHTFRPQPWYPLGLADADSGSLCLILPPTRRQSVGHHTHCHHTMQCERQLGLSWHLISHPLPCSLIFVLGTFHLFVFISILISFNMLPSLSPNKEWVPKQGDHFMEISVGSWMKNTHSQGRQSCHFNSSGFIW